MFCTKCGKNIVAGSEFCVGCGIKVNTATQQPATTPHNTTPHNANTQQAQSGTSFLGGLQNTLMLTTGLCILRFVYAIVWTYTIIVQLSFNVDTTTILWNAVWTIVSYVIATKLLFARRSNPLDINLLCERIGRYGGLSLIGLIWYGWQREWLVFMIDLAIVIITAICLISFYQLGYRDRLFGAENESE